MASAATPHTTQRKYLAFDLETVTLFPQGANWQEYRPLGIGCAAARTADGREAIIWHGNNSDGEIPIRMTQPEAANMVRDLVAFADDGYTILTWNGLLFDLNVLAEESGLWAECRALAHDHVDMMFHLFCERNFRLALSTACKGMAALTNIDGKTEEMDGAIAVQMWHDGQRQAVIDYCVQDAQTTLDLGLACEHLGRLSWTSQRGRPQTLDLRTGWRTVETALLIPEPDTSWMTNPQPRSDFTSWLQA